MNNGRWTIPSSASSAPTIATPVAKRRAPRTLNRRALPARSSVKDEASASPVTVADGAIESGCRASTPLANTGSISRSNVVACGETASNMESGTGTS